MTIKVLYQKDSGRILQWQEFDKYVYEEPSEEQAVIDATEKQLSNQEKYFSIVSGKLSTKEPLYAPIDVEELRLRAYANPVKGSDRYFAEAASLEAQGGNEADVKALKDKGLVRKAEIKALYPN